MTMAVGYHVITRENTTVDPFGVPTESVKDGASDFAPDIIQPSSILYLFLYLVLILAVIFGNGLVLLAIYLEKSLRTPTNYFIANLACADLLLGTLVLPFSGVKEVTGRWYFGHVFCDVWAATDVLCCTASITSLCVISIDRYIGVTRPLKHRLIMTSRRALWLIVMVWLLSLLIAVGPLLGWRPPKDDPLDCPLSDQVDYVIFSVLGSFYIPLLIIVILYVKIYHAVSKESRKLDTRENYGNLPKNEGGIQVSLRVHRGTSRSFSNQHEPTREKSTSFSNSKTRSARWSLFQRRAITFKREKKVAKILGIVVGVFIFCWFPFFFLLPLTSIYPDSRIPPGFFTFAFWLGYCNSFVNPIIYGASNRTFRKTFNGLLTCRYCCGRRRRLAAVKKTSSHKTFHEFSQTVRSNKATFFRAASSHHCRM